MRNLKFQNINFTLSPISPPHSETGYSIEGNIYNEAGNPIREAMIVATNQQFDTETSSFSDDTGHYIIGNLNSGDYKISFIAGGYAPEFYDNQQIWEEANIISLTTDIDNINAELNRYK